MNMKLFSQFYFQNAPLRVWLSRQLITLCDRWYNDVQSGKPDPYVIPYHNTQDFNQSIFLKSSPDRVDQEKFWYLKKLKIGKQPLQETKILNIPWATTFIAS